MSVWTSLFLIKTLVVYWSYRQVAIIKQSYLLPWLKRRQIMYAVTFTYMAKHMQHESKYLTRLRVTLCVTYKFSDSHCNGCVVFHPHLEFLCATR